MPLTWEDRACLESCPSRAEGTFQVKNSARAARVLVSADGRGLVSQAGAVLLWETMRVTGLGRGLSEGLSMTRPTMVVGGLGPPRSGDVGQGRGDVGPRPGFQDRVGELFLERFARAPPNIWIKRHDVPRIGRMLAGWRLRRIEQA